MTEAREQEPSRAWPTDEELLAALSDGPSTVRALAGAMGKRVRIVRTFLQRLEREGLCRSEEDVDAKGRRRQVWRLPRWGPGGTGSWAL